MLLTERNSVVSVFVCLLKHVFMCFTVELKTESMSPATVTAMQTYPCQPLHQRGNDNDPLKLSVKSVSCKINLP